MTDLSLPSLTDYIENHIQQFHENRLEKLKQLKLKDVLKRKNPYLFKAKNILTAHEIVKGILDAYLSSQEETLFGDFMEALAIYICQQVYGGYKPPTTRLTGIDLIFQKADVLYIVEIKSGPHWGNSSQVNKMLANFEAARTILAPQYPELKIIAVNGCSYGIHARHSQRSGAYFKLCGQDFWHLISGNERLYLNIIEPLGTRAQQHDDVFKEKRAEIVNLFIRDFTQEFCTHTGAIDWEKLVNFVSQRPSSSSYPFT